MGKRTAGSPWGGRTKVSVGRHGGHPPVLGPGWPRLWDTHLAEKEWKTTIWPPTETKDMARGQCGA